MNPTLENILANLQPNEEVSFRVEHMALAIRICKHINANINANRLVLTKHLSLTELEFARANIVMLTVDEMIRDVRYASNKPPE